MAMNTDADGPLIRAAQGGDADAFAELVGRHYDAIYRFAYRWCMDQASAQDIAQQCCLKLADRLEQFRFQSAFSTWLYRLVINTAKDWQRREQRHQHAPLESATATDAPAHEAPIYLGQILRELKAMGKGYCETALLVLGEGLSHGEAAAVLDVKESTVSWRLHDLRKRLSDSHGSSKQ